MLRIVDENNRTKFVLTDDAEEPVEIDELVLADEEQPKKKGKKSAKSKKSSRAGAKKAPA